MEQGECLCFASVALADRSMQNVQEEAKIYMISLSAENTGGASSFSRSFTNTSLPLISWSLGHRSTLTLCVGVSSRDRRDLNHDLRLVTGLAKDFAECLFRIDMVHLDT